MTRFILPLAVAVLLLATALRFHALESQSLWNDEGSSYGQALRAPADIWVNAAADIHPPGYYLLLAGWRGVAGDSEFALRALSAFASLVSAAGAFAIARRLYGCTAGLIALAAVAVNTFSITYAQEMRMYALLAACAAASTWALVLVLHGAGRGRVAALLLTTAAGLYTNYAYAGVLAMQGVMGLAWLLTMGAPRAVFARLVLAYGGALLLFLPWLPTAFAQVTQWGSTGAPIPLGDALTVVTGYLLTGVTYPVTGVSTAAMLLVVLGLVPRAGKRPFDRQAVWALALPVVWIAVTLAGFLALELFREANLKFLLPLQLAAAVWMGRGAWVLWHLPVSRPQAWARRMPKLAALAMGAAVMFGGWGGLDALYTAPEYQRDDYRSIVRDIAAEGGAQAGVILNGPGQSEVFGYHMRREGAAFAVYPLPVGMTPDPEATQRAVGDILTSHARVYGVFWGTDERDPQRLVERALAEGAYPVDERWVGRVRLARYVTGSAEAVIPLPEDVTFGGQIGLSGARLSASDIAAGDVLQVELDWVRVAEVPLPVVVTVQLLDAEGRVVAQRDAQPLNGFAPFASLAIWQAQTDRHALMIPNDLPAAQYRLIVALYTPDHAMMRLPVGGVDALTLTELSVSARQGGEE